MGRTNLQALRKPDGSMSLVCTGLIKSGSVLHILVGEAENRTKFTIEQDGKHYVDETVMYMNHSCDPNCKIIEKQVISIKDMQPFTELTFDYATTETSIHSPFQCRCGSGNCRGRVV